MRRKASIKIAAVTLAVFLITLAIPLTGAFAEVEYGRVGTLSPTVKKIETMLSALGYNPGTVDYRYDAKTAVAVKSFQRDSGLPVTGVVDGPTFNALRAAHGKVGASTPAPAPAPSPSGLTSEESLLVSLINNERTSRGLQPLQVDMRLVGTARAKARDMVANRYFSHTSPTLGTPFEQIKNAGITGYTLIGENIAIAPSVQQAHTNFMNSDGHRKNILDARYTHIGVGVINDSAWGKVVVEHFAGR